MTGPIDIHRALQRFSNFSLVTQIGDQSNVISGNIDNFGKRRAEIRLLKFLRDRTISRKQASGDYGLVLRSPIDSTRICQSCVREASQLRTINHSRFCRLKELDCRSTFLLPHCEVVGGVNRLHYPRHLLHAVVTARLVFTFSRRVIFAGVMRVSLLSSCCVN